MGRYQITADEYKYCWNKFYLLHPKYVWSDELGRCVTAKGQELVDRDDEERAMMKADYAWQAAFDGVMAGVDEELIAIVDRLNRHAEESSMFLYAHGWRWDEDGNRITQPR